MLARRYLCARLACRFSSTATSHQDVPQRLKLLSEYRPPLHTIEEVDLLFKLHLERTQVKTRLVVRRLVQSLPLAARFVELHGSKMLHPVNGSFKINGVRCAAGSIQPTSSGGLRIALDGTAAAEDERFLLDFENVIKPSENKALMGLYTCGLASLRFTSFCRCSCFPVPTDPSSRNAKLRAFAISLIISIAPT